MLTNVDQNRSWTAASNASGEYVFVQIPPGRYTLSAEAPGFKKYERRAFVLEVAQILGLPVKLEIGAVTETVEVTGEAPILETQSSTLGEVINSRTTESLPLNGRNVLQLIQLAPGINTTRSYRTATDSNATIPAVAFSANGGRNVSNSVLVDGSPQEVMGYNQAAYIPNPDAVQEFKVQTNNLSAEYGRTGGAVVNVVSRSGTSEFHGVLYEFLRNNAFDANGFFNNREGRAKGPFRFNQFGATVGGPLTPSRQRSFFFFSYEGVRQVNPSTSFFTVPTARMRQGDFSEISNTIYDPLTINSAGIRQPFAGNIIPADRISPVAREILSYYPQPNREGIVNNYLSQEGSRPSNNNYSVRIDHRLTDSNNLFGRVSWNDWTSEVPNHFGNVASPNTGVDGRVNRSVTLDDSQVLGNWVLHGNLGYAYASNPRTAPGSFNLTSLGLPESVANAAQFDIFPRLEPAGYAALGGNPTWVIGNKFETYTGTGDATTLIGRHTIKLGGTYRLNKVSNFRPNAPAGLFTFSENWTRRQFNRAGGGDALATMMLGYLGGGRMQQEPRLGITVPYYALYVQDDWRVNDRFTLNIGLRWDTDRPMREMHDRTSWFDFDAPFPVQVDGLPQLYGGLVFAGRDGNPRGNKNPDNNNFAPRIGVAYRLTGNVVLRSGFGIFYNPTTGLGPSAGNTGAIGFNAVTNINSSNDGGRTAYATLANPFPDGLNQPENGANGLMTFAGQGFNAINRGDRTPYSMQWNFNVQYELQNNMLLDVAYAGNSGVKLPASSQMNQLPDQYLALGDDLNDVVPNPFFGIFPGTSPLGRATTTRGQLLRPYPQFTGVNHVWGSLAHSSYHSLQTKFRKRYGNGLQMLATYTWSKMIDDVSSVAGFLGQQNPDYTNNNRRDLDKSISALDVPHRFVTNFQYELPFGRGKPWASSGVLSRIIGGWSLNAIGTIQSGLPISINSRQNTTNSFGGDQRPDSTGISSVTAGSAKQRLDNWFNPAAFTDAAPYTFGNVGRLLPVNRGPSYHGWDISVLKNVELTERVRLQFRSEFFNAFNQVNFHNPSGTTFGRPEFGQITATEPARIIQFGLKLYY
jgi:hypothetical protein